MNFPPAGSPGHKRMSGISGRAVFCIRVLLLCLALTPAARANVYVIPPGGGDLAGRMEFIEVVDEETLADVARDHKIGHEEIRIANPDVEFWLPPPGAEVALPTYYVLPKAQREGIVLNVPEMRLYYFPLPCTDAEKQCMVITYPVSIGRMDWRTPLGTTRVTGKMKDPPWRPPESIRLEAAAEGHPLPAVVPPGPNNPMGAFAIYLDLPGYRIHGTNKPFGIGLRATHGCVRLYPEDIEDLFDRVDVGTKVQIVSQSIKFGWDGDILYMEVSPPLDEDIESESHFLEIALQQLEEIALQRSFTLDGDRFRRALEEMSGIPVPISRTSSQKKTGAG